MVDNQLTPRQKLLLLFLGSGERFDPIRIQKGLFLFSQKAPQEWVGPDERYHFEPYLYGPYASDIRADLFALRSKGYVQTTESWNPSWKFHSLTPDGEKAYSTLLAEADPRVVKYMKAIADYVTRASFSDLLRTIYAKFPEYAENSVFKY